MATIEPPETQNKDAAESLEVVTPEGSLPGAVESSASGSEVAASGDLVTSIKGWAWWVFEKFQAAGEVVAGVIGLNDSKFQYVMDNMSEEDWKIARAHEARRLANIAGAPYEEMEGGSTPVQTSVLPPEPPSAVESRE
jgi:hypothetical protein